MGLPQRRHFPYRVAKVWPPRGGPAFILSAGRRVGLSWAGQPGASP